MFINIFIKFFIFSALVSSGAVTSIKLAKHLPILQVVQASKVAQTNYQPPRVITKPKASKPKSSVKPQETPQSHSPDPKPAIEEPLSPPPPAQPEPQPSEPTTPVPEAAPQQPEEAAELPQTAPEIPDVPQILSITTSVTGYVPDQGYGLWMPNYVVAHNPGDGAVFLTLSVGSQLMINQAKYQVSEIYRIYGPPASYPKSSQALRYKDYYDPSIDRAALIFDGRMTIQTCVDDQTSIWVYKLTPC